MTGVAPLSPKDLAQRLSAGEDFLLVDVRESVELSICVIDGVQHLPMNEIPQRMQELDSARQIVCICHHGIRSAHVANFLAQNGFEHIYNLTGGMESWAVEVDTDMARY